MDVIAIKHMFSKYFNGDDSVSKTSLAEINNQSYMGMLDNQTLHIHSLTELLGLREIFCSKTRLMILYHIGKYGEIGIKELAETLNLPISTVSKNVKKLEEKGLVLSGLRNGSRGLKK